MKLLIKFSLALLLLAPLHAMAQGVRYDNIALLDSGRPAQGIGIRVCSSGSTGTPCTPAASIFTDSALTVAITQPGFQSDAQGNYNFYAACGKYDIQLTGNGVTTKTLKDVQLGACLNFTWGAFAPTVSGVQSIGAFVPANGIKITGIVLEQPTASAGCTTFPVVSVFDNNTLTVLASVTEAAATTVSNVGLSVNATAGHVLFIRTTTSGVGCTTNATNVNITVQYQMQ